MQYRALFLFSSALTLAIAVGCSSDDDSGNGSGAGAAGTAGTGGASNAGSAGKAGGNAGKAGSGEAGGTGEEAGSGGVIDSAGAGGEAGGSDLPPLPTLDGSVPLVIGHRGLPGLHPEETIVSYDGAVAAGADSLEEDLHLTKDCVLVARHNPWLSDNTNITAVAATNATVMARKRTVPGVAVPVTYSLATYGGPATYLSDLTVPADQTSVLKSLIVDGEDHTGDWSITDFTVAELKQWIAGTTYDARDQRPTYENGKYPILTMQEIIDKAKAASKATGRTITVYPEAKNPYWNNQQAIANGCAVGSSTHPFEDAIIKLIEDNDLNDKAAPIMVQSFDPASLKYMRSKGLKTKFVQLIDGNDVNYETGEMIYKTDDVYNFVDGRPYSWTLAGDGRYFGAMLTPDGLADVKTYADGIGPWKPQVMSWKAVPYNAGASFTTDVNTIAPTSLIADAHAKGLFVHSYTFRNEQKYLAAYYKGDPMAEYIQFFKAGIDGVFTDFANTGFAARAEFLKEMGR
ncbi:MAG: glycerophosphodiester phosphodiesterase family protein [Pseudomonadota bacterium]